MRLGGAIAAAREAFLPALCLHCSQPLAGDEGHLCWECWSMVVPAAGLRCALCGGPCGDETGPCLSCAQSPPPQNGTVIWGEHCGVLRTALLALKHRGRDDLARPLGARLAVRVSTESWASSIDVVTQVPSHPVHRLRRGWTAAGLLAAEVARRLDLDTAPLLRRRGLARQAGRSRVQRLALGPDRFAARKGVSGRRLLVVDDVTTTGATLRQATAVLRRAGAEAVFCAALATVPDGRMVT